MQCLLCEDVGLMLTLCVCLAFLWEQMYPKIMKELLRVLRVGGRAGERVTWLATCVPCCSLTFGVCCWLFASSVLLIIAKNLFLSSIQHLPLLQVVQEHEVNIGGLRGIIFILEKQNSTSSAT